MRNCKSIKLILSQRAWHIIGNKILVIFVFLFFVSTLFVSLLLIVSPKAIAGTPYPIKASANGRYLVDASGAPFLLMGDSPQALMVNVSEADAATYFYDRRMNGFNAVLIDAVCTTYTGGRPDSSTYDGILPFTANVPGHDTYDLTKPNETYWARVDRFLTMAADNGLIVFLDPLETGGYLRDTPTFQDNGSNNCRIYGQFLANRYAGFTNIIWWHGNDFDYPEFTASGDQYVTAIANGIMSVDSNQLQTVLLGAQQDSRVDSNWVGIVGLNAAYAWSPTYDTMLLAYRRSPILPVFMAEDHYEEQTVGSPPEANNSELGTPLVLRKQDYWTMLSGGTGKLYGNQYTVLFSSGWQSQMDTTGVYELGLWKDFFGSLPWYNLVPDTNHSILISGYGTYATNGLVSTNDYVTAASTPDGALMIAYLPVNRAVTVDMSKFAGPCDARWFDPTAGVYTTIDGSPFTNSGTQDFAPPGTNSGGDEDWVLVLKDSPPESAGPTIAITAPTQGTTVSNAILVSAAGSNNVAGVQFQVDGVNLGSEMTTPPYVTAWNTLGLGNGTHTLQAVARDADGNLATNSILVTVNNEPDLVPTADLAAAYGFDEGLGTAVSDSSGNGNDGAIQGAIWIPTGKYGQALYFANSSLVTVSNSVSLNLTNGVTLTAWVYPTAPSSWSTVLMKQQSAQLAYALYAAGFHGAPTTFFLNTTNLENLVGENPLPLDTWSHLAATYDGAMLSLFVNGAIVASNSASGSLAPSSGPLQIGGNSIWGEYFSGAIDEVRVFNRALNEEEINADMNTPTTSLAKVFLLVKPQTADQIQQNGLHFYLSPNVPLSGYIEYSTNMISWQQLGPFSCTNGSIEIADHAAAGSTPRFYRAVHY